MSDNEEPDQNIVSSPATGSSAGGDEDADLGLCLDEELLNSLNEMASRLCSICRGFFHGTTDQVYLIDDSDYRIYHPSLSSLQKSVDAGCDICKDLSQSLDEFLKECEPPKTPPDSWSIRCSLWKYLSWKRDRDPFLLLFYLSESTSDHRTRACRESFDLSSMTFYPADITYLGPEFRGMLVTNGRICCF